MIGENKIIIAAAGSGKTTYLVNEAIKIKDQRILITTYTESNESEIRQKFFDLVGHVPSNVVIMTWFSFLITHGVKPFQGGLFEFPVSGMLLVSERSGLKYRNAQGNPVYWSEDDFEQCFFDPKRRIYSDKLSKLAFRCNEKSRGAVIDRISSVFPHVFVDEVQDLAGYDLDILGLLARSPAHLVMVGDPRQVTYLTHHERRHKQYANGGILNFLRTLPKKASVDIDEETLSWSHRNSDAICELSSQLYPDLKSTRACTCARCRSALPEHSGLFIVQRADYAHYLETVKPVQLRDSIITKGVDSRFDAMNFGESKGRGFDHVTILPTKPMGDWLFDRTSDLKPQSRAKLYVALTRGRHSLAIVMDVKGDQVPEGFSIYQPSTQSAEQYRPSNGSLPG